MEGDLVNANPSLNRPDLGARCELRRGTNNPFFFPCFPFFLLFFFLDCPSTRESDDHLASPQQLTLISKTEGHHCHMSNLQTEREREKKKQQQPKVT